MGQNIYACWNPGAERPKLAEVHQALLHYVGGAGSVRLESVGLLRVTLKGPSTEVFPEPGDRRKMPTRCFYVTFVEGNLAFNFAQQDEFTVAVIEGAVAFVVRRWGARRDRPT